VVETFVTRKHKVFKVRPGWIEDEVGEGSVIPENAIALGVENSMEILHNSLCDIVISFRDESGNDRGRCPFSCTQECMKDTQAARARHSPCILKIYPA
jgi:hypothetical protein